MVKSNLQNVTNVLKTQTTKIYIILTKINNVFHATIFLKIVVLLVKQNYYKLKPHALNVKIKSNLTKMTIFLIRINFVLLAKKFFKRFVIVANICMKQG